MESIQVKMKLGEVKIGEDEEKKEEKREKSIEVKNLEEGRKRNVVNDEKGKKQVRNLRNKVGIKKK